MKITFIRSGLPGNWQPISMARLARVSRPKTAPLPRPMDWPAKANEPRFQLENLSKLDFSDRKTAPHRARHQRKGNYIMVKLSHAEINWLIQALEHYMAELNEIMDSDSAQDYEKALARILFEGRRALRDKLHNIMANNDRRIAVDAPQRRGK